MFKISTSVNNAALERFIAQEVNHMLEERVRAEVRDYGSNVVKHFVRDTVKQILERPEFVTLLENIALGEVTTRVDNKDRDRQIYSRYETGETVASIARDIGLSTTRIRAICAAQQRKEQRNA